MSTIQITIRGGDSMGLTIRELPPDGTQRTMSEALHALGDEIRTDKGEQDEEHGNNDASQSCTV